MTIITQNRWNVRIVPVGQTRGTSGSLINIRKEPIVEFFDGLNAKGDNNLGQLVQAYSLSTLLNRDMAAGLDLYASAPEWTVSRDDMIQITHGLHAWNKAEMADKELFIIVFHFEDDSPMMRAVQSTGNAQAVSMLMDTLSKEYDMDCVEGESVYIDQVQTITALKVDMLV
jgi:hypothetical protein